MDPVGVAVLHLGSTETPRINDWDAVPPKELARRMVDRLELGQPFVVLFADIVTKRSRRGENDKPAKVGAKRVHQGFPVAVGRAWFLTVRVVVSEHDKENIVGRVVPEEVCHVLRGVMAHEILQVSRRVAVSVSRQCLHRVHNTSHTVPRAHTHTHTNIHTRALAPERPRPTHPPGI